MDGVEIIYLGAFDPKSQQREFDAVSGRLYWRGLLGFEQWSESDARVCVYSDRNNVLGDDYGWRQGTLEEVRDDTLAKAVIAKAVEQCFDHTITLEALSDGYGGWIALQTDT